MRHLDPVLRLRPDVLYFCEACCPCEWMAEPGKQLRELAMSYSRRPRKGTHANGPLAGPRSSHIGVLNEKVQLIIGRV